MSNIAILSSGGGGGTPGGTPGQVQFNNAGAFGGFTVSGDGTLNTATGALNITGSGGVLFGTNAFNSTAFAPLASPTFSGNVTMPDGVVWSNAGIASPTFTGTATAAALTASGILRTSSAGSAAAPSLDVGNPTTGLYSVSTTGLGFSVNGVSVFDYGITVASKFSFGNGSATTLTLSSASTAAIFFSNNAGGISFRNGNTLLSSPATAVLQQGAADAAAPVAQTLQVQSVVAGNTNVAGATFTIAGSKSNGSGGGDVVLQTTLSSAASGTQNTLATALTLKGGTQEAIFAGPVRLKGYTVATLPAGNQGDYAFVTDALAPTFLAALVGGGAVVAPAFYNGTAWVGG